MAPLNKNDYIMINKLKVTFNLLNEGDIIMYRHHDQIHFSRIGKAGESVEIRHGKLYKDDRQVNKYYAKIEILMISHYEILKILMGILFHLTHFSVE